MRKNRHFNGTFFPIFKKLYMVGNETEMSLALKYSILAQNLKQATPFVTNSTLSYPSFHIARIQLQVTLGSLGMLHQLLHCNISLTITSL